MVLAALLLAGVAQAQETGSASDYRLPPSSSQPPAEGPVDSDHPVAAPTRAAPQPSASAAPVIVLPPEPEAQTDAMPRRDVFRPLPVPEGSATASGARPAFPDILPADEAPEVEVAPETPGATEAPSEVTLPREEGPGWWFPVLLGLLGLLSIGGFFWSLARPSRRVERAAPARREPAPQPQAEPQPELEPEPESEPAPIETEAPAPASPIAPATLAPISQAASPAPLAAAGTLEFLLEPRTLRLSFVYATLSYRLTLTNPDEAACRDLRVYGDLASGHASQPIGQQLSLDGVPLEHKHDVAGLAPGEAVTLTGELRVPLAEILVLRAGAAQLFAPLARFLVEGERDGGTGLTDTHVFTIGQPSERQGETMQPFRLDLGPQLFERVEQREIDIARWLQLDPARRAG